MDPAKLETDYNTRIFVDLLMIKDLRLGPGRGWICRLPRRQTAIQAESSGPDFQPAGCLMRIVARCTGARSVRARPIPTRTLSPAGGRIAVALHGCASWR